MMHYWKNEETFQFKKEELSIIYAILSEKEQDMKASFESKDPHKFIELVQLKSKVEGYIWIMNEKEKHESEAK